MKKELFYAIEITLACSIAGQYLSVLPGFSLIGALVISLIFGMMIAPFSKFKKVYGEATGFISNKFLRAVIILLGFKLKLQEIFTYGPKILIFAAATVALAFFIYFILCRFVLKEDEEISLLASAGCSICGAAAVMGVSPQLNAKKDNTVTAIAVVCILGTVFTLVEIFLQQNSVFGLNAEQYGLVAGASLHEIAHAVAAGYAVEGAHTPALLMKLSRVLMLAPTALIMGMFFKSENKNAKVPFPYFMLGFIAASVAGSVLPLSENFSALSVKIGYVLLGMAMAALGMSVNFKVLKEKGAKLLTSCFIGSVIHLLIAVVAVKLIF